MNIKITIATICLVLIIGATSSYFFIKNLRINSENKKNNEQISALAEKSIKEGLRGIGNPIQWVKNQSSDKEYSKNIKDAFSNIKKEDSQESTMGALNTAAKIQIAATTSQIAANINNINPKNLENLDYLISEMKKSGVKQNMSDEKLLALEKAIREVMATSTDLTAEFYKNVNIKYINAESKGFFKKILSMFSFIKISNAAIRVVPFGGRVILATPCTCSLGVWIITFEPTQPTYATFLSYISGTQLFSSYIPTPHTAQHFLGFYLPGAQACYFYAGTTCVPFPSWGTITPDVGSSI